MKQPLPVQRVKQICQFLALLALLIGLTAAQENQPPVLMDPPLAPPAPLELTEEMASSNSLASDRNTYLPVITLDTSQRKMNPRSRQAAVDLYRNEYLNSKNISPQWTGNYDSCSMGTVSQSFRDTVLRRINYYRVMAGIPPIKSFQSGYNQQEQAAALMMSINNKLDHNPPSNWRCYSASGAEAAGQSNLALGASGPRAIDLYMDDNGIVTMGHRRWILYPQTQVMGTGDTPGNGTYWPSNALRAWDEHIWDSRPATRDPFVAWPPASYVPYQVVNEYWSFAVAKADFSQAIVKMTSGGSNVPVTQYPSVSGFGENTLVWKVNQVEYGWPRPAADQVYNVTVSNVRVNNKTLSYSYQVTIIDPDQ